MSQDTTSPPTGDGPQPTPPDHYPYYNIRDEEDDLGNFQLHKILIDSPEGRTYAALTTHEERLAYMRAHAHDSYRCVQADTAFYEDSQEGKRYNMKIRSLEYEGLQKLKDEHGGSLRPGDEGWDDVVRYYKEHATQVEEFTPRECKRQVCDLGKDKDGNAIGGQKSP